jgi:hypothetical protein
MSALSPTTGVKTGKAQNQQTFSGLPPKADFPILELLPPPAPGERSHRTVRLAFHPHAVEDRPGMLGPEPGVWPDADGDDRFKGSKREST